MVAWRSDESLGEGDRKKCCLAGILAANVDFWCFK
jgi:hypothetical protein